MTASHPVWFTLTWACVIWYATVTLYVAVRGARDVRSMLARLEADQQADANTDA